MEQGIKEYWPVWSPIPNYPWRIAILGTQEVIRDENGEAIRFQNSDQAFAHIEKLERKKQKLAL